MLDEERRRSRTEKEGKVTLLEFPLQDLKHIVSELKEYMDNQELTYQRKDESVTKSDKDFEEIVKNKKNPVELRLLASHAIIQQHQLLEMTASSNYIYSLLGMFVGSMHLALISISNDIEKIKASPAKTPQESNKIKALEEDIVTLKTQLEMMKPTFQKFKKDYAQRKKWLKDNQ